MQIDQSISALVSEIDGFLSDREGNTLHDLAKKGEGWGSIVEIGSWKGKSTIWIAKAISKNVSFYAIDPHIGSSEHQTEGPIWTFEEFKQNIARAGVQDKIIPLVQTSEDARRSVDEPLGFLFIDGAHEYEFVKKDFELWSLCWPLLSRPIFCC